MKKTLVGVLCLAVLNGFADGNFTVTTNGTEVTVKAVGGTLPVFTEPFQKESVSRVIFEAAGTPFKYNPTEASTYEGGTAIASGQLYACRGDAFGSGEIVVGSTGDASLMVRDLDVEIPNKVVFPRSMAYAVGFGDTIGSLTLHSLGTSGSAYHTVRLGRSSAGSVGRVTLALTEPESEAVNQYILSGALQLKLDGGTIKASSSAKTPFFGLAFNSDVTDITVTTKGVTFDSPANTMLKPGQPLKFASASVTNVVETCAPTNPGFEDGKTANWTYTTLSGGEGDSEIKTSPTAWDGNGTYPPIGKKYAMIRRLASLQSPVDVPNDGLWRVAFYRGGRPGGYSATIQLDVAVDGITNHFPATSVLDFTEYRTPPFELTAGPHVLAFVTSNAGSGHSLNIDEVRLERVEISEVYGSLTKTGAGALAFDGQSFEHVPVTVSAGTLKLDAATLSDNEVSVASGACVRLRESTLAADAAVEVAVGGTLALSDLGDNFAVNGSFEDGNPGDYTESSVTPSGWRCSRDQVLANNSSYGLQKNGGTLTGSGPLTPAGEYTVYLRDCQSVYQTNSVTVAGTYRISFLSADRAYANSHKVPFSVSVDGETKLAVAAREAYAGFTRHTVDVELGTGDHEIRLSTGNGGDTLGNMVFFDDVRVRKVADSALALEGEIRMASGSTLDLDLVNALTVKNFFVDGVPVNGKRAAISRAGVNVTGAGDIRVGERQGMLLLFR